MAIKFGVYRDAVGSLTVERVVATGEAVIEEVNGARGPLEVVYPIVYLDGLVNRVATRAR